MPNFPRNPRAMPRLISPMRFPSAFQSWSPSGKAQMRATANMGRVWTETYPVLDMALVNVRILIQTLNQALREGTVFTVQHLYWQKRVGVGGGTPLVNGSGQSGNILVIDGATANITNWLRQGDLIQVPGVPVLLDVAGDVSTDAGGNASILISPPIFVGSGPPDDAAVEINPANITIRAIVTDISDFPAADVTRYIDEGMTVTFREQPT